MATRRNSGSGGEIPPQWRNPNFPQRCNYIPEEIVEDILPRLPVKSLVRFKCVSKFWNSTISNPDFALSDYRRAKAVFLASKKKSFSVYVMNDQAVTEEIRWRRTETFRREPFGHHYEFIGGSCNGLLLLVMGKSLFLWNPSTGYMRKVLELSHLDESGYRVRSGLCFDSSCNDYKVIIGISHQILESSCGRGYEFVIVASLEEKQWREIQFPYQVSLIEHGPVLNGFLHWKVHERDRKDRHSLTTPQKIVAFDPKSDEFKELPMPQPNNRDGNVVLGLGVLGGCLSMAHWDNKSVDIVDGSIQVLAMKEYGVRESWTVMFEISGFVIASSVFDTTPFHDTSPRLLLLIRNDEILLSFGNDKILIYNHKKMNYRIVRVQNTDRDDCGEEVFVVSLASPTGCEWDAKKHGRPGEESECEMEQNGICFREEIILQGFQDAYYYNSS